MPDLKTDETSVRPGETAADFKKRIEETQRELKREEAARNAPKVQPEPSKSVEVVTPAQVTPASPDLTRQERPQVAPTMATGNPEVDEWLGKKGFKSMEDMAVSLRELEREYHRKAQETRTPTPPAPPVMAPPIPGVTGYPPSAPPVYPGAWYPPAPPPPAPNAEELAKRYNMTPEDFERVASLANDMAEAKLDRRLSAIMPGLTSKVQNIERETEKQRDLVNLMADPVFKNPQVQFEMHRVIEENPSIFEKSTLPYRTAFNEALTRVARATLGGTGTPAPATTPGRTPGARPPQTAGGNGNGGGGAPSETPSEVTADAFARMSLKEKAEYLRAVGAR